MSSLNNSRMNHSLKLNQNSRRQNLLEDDHELQSY